MSWSLCELATKGRGPCDQRLWPSGSKALALGIERPGPRDQGVWPSGSKGLGLWIKGFGPLLQTPRGFEQKPNGGFHRTQPGRRTAALRLYPGRRAADGVRLCKRGRWNTISAGRYSRQWQSCLPKASEVTQMPAVLQDSSCALGAENHRKSDRFKTTMNHNSKGYTTQ